MNIFKNKKIIATALTFVLVMTLAYQPLTAKERRGATVEVTMADGSLVKGELLAVKSDALLIFDHDAGRGMSLDLRQVARVKVIKKLKSWKGVLTGFYIGTVLVLGSRLKFPNSGKDEELSNLGFPFLAGMFGGLVGGLTSMPEKFSLSKESFDSMQQNLEQLKRYAREQDGLGMTEAESGNRPLSPENTVPLPPDHSLPARIMTKNEEAAADEREVGRVGKMILAGIAGNIIGTGAGVGLGIGLNTFFPAGHDAIIWPGVLLGAPAGSLFGSALGVCLAGNSRNARGNFGSAVLGSFLGELAAVAVASSAGLGEEEGGAVTTLFFAVLPPIGAAILFNHSLRPRSLPKVNALFILADGRFGLGIPDIRVRPLFVPGVDAKPDWQFSARVLSVEL